MQKNWHNLLRFARFIAVRFSEDRCLQIAASLTFTTLLSLVPLVTIALTLFSAFPVFEDFSIQIKTYLLNNLMPDAASKVITKYMHQFTESAMRLTAVGILFLGATAMMMLVTIEHAFNTIWGVSKRRPLVKRLVVYWAVLTLAPLLVGASLSLTSWLVGLSMGYAKHIPVFGVGALKILPVFLTTLAFALLFRLVPNRHVPRMHALIGAIVSAIAFELMNHLFSYYIKSFATYKLVYGAFASVPVFLLWVYLCWLTILLGAVIAASLSYWRASTAHQLSPVRQLLGALRVLKIMEAGLQQGKVSNFPELSKSLHLGYDVLDEILEKLADANMVRNTEGKSWLLIRDTGHIRAAELLHLFVLDHGTLPAVDNNDPLRQWVATSIGRLEHRDDLTLQELFARHTA